MNRSSNVFKEARMSIEQAQAFKDLTAQNEAIQEEILSLGGLPTGAYLSELGRRHSYEFTAEESDAAWETAQQGELSEFELEMVSGGDKCTG